MNFLSVVIKPEVRLLQVALKSQRRSFENSAAATEGSVEPFVVSSELDGMKEEQKMAPKAFTPLSLTESLVLNLPGFYG